MKRLQLQAISYRKASVCTFRRIINRLMEKGLRWAGDYKPLSLTRKSCFCTVDGTGYHFIQWGLSSHCWRNYKPLHTMRPTITLLAELQTTSWRKCYFCVDGGTTDHFIRKAYCYIAADPTNHFTKKSHYTVKKNTSDRKTYLCAAKGLQTTS